MNNKKVINYCNGFNLHSFRFPHIQYYINILSFLILFSVLFSSCKMNTNPQIKFMIPGSLLLPATTYSVGGTLTLLGSGKSVVVQLNGSTNLTIAANGTYSIGGLANNATYDLDVLTQPTNQVCTISNATGTIAGANITNADISCSIGVLSSGTIINPLTLTGGVTTLNGSPCAATASGCSSVSGYSDSTSPDSVLFSGGAGITTDGTNLFVADTNNHRIRKVVIATGATTTLAGNGVDAKVDGKGTAASISQPRYITTDGNYLFVSDATNDCIRKININTTVVTTLATDSTLLSTPRGLVVSGTNLYVLNNNSDRLRHIDTTTGTITTLISSGLNSPRNMTIIGNDLYIADSGADEILKTTIGTWVVSTFAGSTSGYADGTGAGARFKDLEGMTTDGTSLYAADTGNHNIRKITIPGAVVTTLAGPLSSTSGYTNSQTFSTARFNTPKGITSDGLNLYVFDSGNNSIRKIQ